MGIADVPQGRKNSIEGRRAPRSRGATPGLLALGMILGSMGLQASAGGYTPEEARARMVVPEGFHVEVFASEPMIRQPVTACFDERGRAWVIEYLQYPHPAGLKPVKVDQYLRTEYDRVPGASPARPARGRPDQDPRGHRRRRQGRQGHGLRRGAEPGDAAWRSATAGSSSGRRLTCSSIPTRTRTTSPTATPRSCSRGSACRTPTRRSTRCSGGPTAGSTAPRGAR